jgi:hypothetical protein
LTKEQKGNSFSGPGCSEVATLSADPAEQGGSDEAHFDVFPEDFPAAAALFVRRAAFPSVFFPLIGRPKLSLDFP